jgi:protein phosphatase
MLCSDGIHGTMPEKELIGYVADRKSSLGAVTDNIATTVDGIGCMDGGGHDNLTIALIETNINSKKKDKMNKNTKILIVVLALVCAISLIFNFMPRSKNSSDEVSELQQKVKVLDSVNKVLERNVADLQGEVKMLKSDSVSNFDKVERQQKLIDRLKEDTAYLRKKLLRAEAQKVQKPKTEAQKESNKKKR